MVPSPALQYGHAGGSREMLKDPKVKLHHPCSCEHRGCLPMAVTSADLPLQPRQSPEVSVKTKIRSQCAWMQEPPQGSAVSPKAWSCLLEQSGLSHSRGELRDGASPLGCHLSLALRTFWMLQLMLKRDLLSHDLDQVLSLGSRVKAFSEPMDSWGCPAGLWPCSCSPQQDHAGQDESPESWRLH